MPGSDARADVASPTISEVLDAFLEDQEPRHSPATHGKYQSILHLFTVSMNNYAYTRLSGSEAAVFERHYRAMGEAHREFCDIFGPDKILENVSEFIDYFMPRKVVCGTGLLKAAGTVTKKLARWLAAEGYVDAAVAKESADDSLELARDAVRAEEASEALFAYVEDHVPETWGEQREGAFFIDRVEPGRLWLRDLSGQRPVAVPVPESISKQCQVGWQINAALGETKNGWRLIEATCVLP